MTMALAAATSSMASQVPRICFSTSTLRQVNTREKGMASRKVTLGVVTSNIPTTPSTSTRSLVILASNAQDKDVNLSSDDSDPAIASQEDLNYLFKLGAGSVLGAVAIK